MNTDKTTFMKCFLFLIFIGVYPRPMLLILLRVLSSFHTRLLKEDFEKYAKIVKTVGIQPQ